MKKYSNGLSNKGRIVLFMIIILMIGILIGFIYYNKLPDITKQMILENVNNTVLTSNYTIIIFHLLILLIIFILSFIIIGLPISHFYLFYEGLSIGFSCAVLFAYKGLKGLIYALIYNIIYKLLFLVLVFVFIFKISFISYNTIKYIFNRNKSNKKVIILKIKSTFLILVLITIIDIINYFVNPYILNVINFLLK